MVTDEMEDLELEEIKEKEVEIDFDKWKQATKSEAEEILRNRDTTETVTVPIDFDRELFITLHIRPLPIHEQLRLLELFMTFDKKGEAKFKWLQYYAAIYTKMIEKTEPSITWKEARFYNDKFLAVLMKYLPNPMDLQTEGILPEKTRKN